MLPQPQPPPPPNDAGHAGPEFPVSALLARIQGLKALAIEPGAANTLLGPMTEQVMTLHPQLISQFERFGWAKGKGYQTVADLTGLASALQKYKYERLGQLGSGSYGVVYKARNKETGTLVAIKKLRYSFDDSGFPDTTLREISTLKALQHENIVQ